MVTNPMECKSERGASPAAEPLRAKRIADHLNHTNKGTGDGCTAVGAQPAIEWAVSGHGQRRIEPQLYIPVEFLSSENYHVGDAVAAYQAFADETIAGGRWKEGTP